jgi:hypothetical protein
MSRPTKQMTPASLSLLAADLISSGRYPPDIYPRVSQLKRHKNFVHRRAERGAAFVMPAWNAGIKRQPAET